MSTENIRVTHSNNIYELLTLLEEKHHYFLTKRTISSLQNFLIGYKTGRVFLNSPEDFHFDNFRYWLSNKFDNIPSDVQFTFSQILLNISNENEEEAFDKFFQYLNEYKQSNNL